MQNLLANGKIDHIDEVRSGIILISPDNRIDELLGLGIDITVGHG